MNPEQFVYWMQGLFEVADPKTLDEKQTAIIKAHLDSVFKNVINPFSKLNVDYSNMPTRDPVRIC